MRQEKEKKYPKVIVGAFIFNEEKEKLLMIKSPAWNNKFSCVGGKIETGEKIEDALKREVKEETNLESKKVYFIGVTEGLNLGKNINKYEHLIFLDYRVEIENAKNIILNEEGESYEWHTIDEWLAKDENEFAPYNYEIIKKLKESEREDDFEEKYKRALADYQNLLRRTEKEKQEFMKFSHEQFLHEILPVYDNLKMALTHSNDNNNDSWLEGVKYVVKQFKDVLTNLGVEEIKTIGKKFDHNTMEAMEGKGNIVEKEIKPGYMLKGKVIIAAKVILGDGKKSDSDK